MEGAIEHRRDFPVHTNRNTRTYPARCWWRYLSGEGMEESNDDDPVPTDAKDQACCCCSCCCCR